MSVKNKTIEDIVKEIKKPTDIIYINWINDIQYKKFDELEYKEHIIEVISEYIITNDVFTKLKEFLTSLIDRIEARDEQKIDIKICFGLRGEYGTGKTHFLTFLSLLLISNEEILDLVEKRLNSEERLQELKELAKKLREKLGDSFIICPIKLTEYDNNIRLIEIIKYRIQEIAILKYKDKDFRLVSVYNVIKWFKQELDQQFRDLILGDLDKITRETIEQDSKELSQLDLEELTDIQSKLINAYEERSKQKFSASMENVALTDVIKESQLYEKHKVTNFLIIIDELSQWWGSKHETDLINQLHGLVENFKNEKKINISFIISYQKPYSSKEFITLKERFNSQWVLQASEFKDIVPKRCLNQDKLDHDEIEKIAFDFSRLIGRLKISEQIIQRFIFFHDDINKEFKTTKEGLMEYFQLYYPFHPTVFLPEIWQLIGINSTQMRGGMNIVKELLERNIYRKMNEIILVNEEIYEIIDEILQSNINLSLAVRRIKHELKIDETSLKFKIILLLITFMDEGLMIEEMNLLLLTDVKQIMEDLYQELIRSKISVVVFESSSKKYRISFESEINIDTTINNIGELINNDNVLNYLQAKANYGEEKTDKNKFAFYRGAKVEKFNYFFIKHMFLNSDNQKEIESEITQLLETRKLSLENHIYITEPIKNFIETNIPDGYMIFFKPSFQKVKNFIDNISNTYKNIIFAYCVKDLKDLEFKNYNLYTIIKLNLIFEILKTILNSSASNFDETFQDFENIFQENYSINFSIITEFRKPLEDFYVLCEKYSSKMSLEIDERAKSIPAMDEDFFDQFKQLYNYKFIDNEFDDYSEVILDFIAKVFPNQLDDLDFFNSTTVNHILSCLREFDDYTPSSNSQQKTLESYRSIGILEKASKKLYRVKLNFSNEDLVPINNLILNKLHDDPVKIRDILLDLRHSSYGLNMEYCLLSIVALFVEGLIKLLKINRGNFVQYPSTEKEWGSFCKKIAQLNNLAKENFYFQKGDLIPDNDWIKIIDFLIFLKELNIFNELKKLDIKPYKKIHNGNSERKILESITALSLSKMQIIQGNIDLFINTIEIDEKIVENLKILDNFTTLENLLKELLEQHDISSIADILRNIQINQWNNMKAYISFFDKQKNHNKLIKLYKNLIVILGK